ncbi:tetratricopeptide repeat protein [Lentimicrobium sp. S6]|uniref:tetratricopeptide repeat protein n=1 Tax=Lentimicrobium sp. S6 TaxID=2735872 RepID=UPI0015524EC7|nr:tetratricopeptide repeat protein [Lentimicrobium sp. S6]NPD44511.1 tetratricopeptide repeat protein [Lentimicrobium sp. S6]
MKNALYITFLVLFLMGINIETYSQNLKLFDPATNGQKKPKKTKQKLATEFYVAGEYEKASQLFEELYEENPSDYFYRYLLYCYVQLEDFRKAEKLVKQTQKNTEKAYKEFSDMGYIEQKKGDVEKANKLFAKAIKELPANKGAILQLANDFRSRGQSDLAEETYFTGQKLLREEYGFESELGYLYYYLEQYDKMTDSYLDLLEIKPEQMKIVQYRIQNAFRRDKEDQIYPYLKQELLSRIKKQEDANQFSELLLWLSIQRRDFNIAVIQAKALDRREGGEYFRVFDLAQVMMNNGAYAQSISALEYIISRPGAKDQVYYPEAIQSLLSAKYGDLRSKNNPSQEEINELSQEFLITLDEMGRFRFTIPMVMNYAELLTYFQDNSDKAIEELNILVEHPGLSKAEKAPAKLLLGDIYLLSDNPWEATLLFSQVEKDFKNDEIGFEARLKNAKLSFYIGEFDWSKAQLDILKAATGKRIANDAMNLSLFIAENLDADSSTRALEYYGKADLLYLRKQDSLALQTLDSIFMLSLYHDIFDNVWMRQSEILLASNQYQEAKVLLEKIVDQYPDGLLADDAIWILAEMELNQFNNEEKASEWYKKILTDYSASIYTNEARKIFRSLRNDFPVNEDADSL